MNKSFPLWLRGAALALFLLLLEACGDNMFVASVQQQQKPLAKTEDPPPPDTVVAIPCLGDAWGEQPFLGKLLGGMEDVKDGRRDRGDEKVRSEAETKTAATQYGLRIHHIDGDGNCLFRGVADQLQKPPFSVSFSSEQDYHTTIRQIAVAQVSNHKALYQDACYDGFQGVEDWLAKMRQDKCWGGQVAIRALSDALQVTLVAIRAAARAGERPTIYKPAQPRGVIYLHFKNGSHYESLSQLTSMSTEQQKQWQMLQVGIEWHTPSSYVPPKLCTLQALICEQEGVRTPQDVVDDLDEAQAATRRTDPALLDEELPMPQLDEQSSALTTPHPSLQQMARCLSAIAEKGMARLFNNVSLEEFRVHRDQLYGALNLLGHRLVEQQEDLQEQEENAEGNYRSLAGELKKVRSKLDVLSSQFEQSLAAPSGEDIAQIKAKLAEIVHQLRAAAERKKEEAQKCHAVPNLPAPAAISFFVGRDKELKRITQALSDKKPQVHLLCGPGGMGKTQLAIRLFNELEETGQYDHVFWLQASTPEQLQLDYFRIADRLGIEIDKKNTKNAISDIRDVLAGKYCLYVFDDAPDSRNVEAFLPTKQGHVLVTSRNSKSTVWGRNAHYWPVQQFDKEALVALAAQFQVGPEALDETTNNYLLEALSGYPLMLAQFFSFCRAQGLSPSDYVKELQAATLSEQEQESFALLNGDPEQEVKYNQSMVQVLKSNIQALQKEEIGKYALSLLSRFAYLAPNGILIDWIVTWDGGQRPLAAKRKTRTAVALLEEYSLVQRDQETKAVSVHAVTQQMVRHLHPQEALQGLIYSLIGYAGDWSYRYNHQAEWTTVLQHGQQLVSYHKASDQAAYDLTQALGRACEIAYLCVAARSWFNINLQIIRELHLDQHNKNLGNNLYHLGVIYFREGDYKRARELYKQALAIKRAVYGEKHPDVAITLHQLGHVYSHEGAYKKARNLYEQVLSIYKQIYEEQHPDVADTLNEMGYVYFCEGDYKKAIKFYEQALAIKKQVYGEKHSIVAWTLNNIGFTCTKQNRYIDALKHYEGALNIINVNQHPRLLFRIYYGMGELYRKQGNLTESAKYYIQSLEIHQKLYGAKSHQEIAVNYIGLGNIYIDQRDYKAAEEALAKTLPIFYKVFPSKSHPEIASGYHAWGRLHYARQDYKGAVEYLEKACAMRKAFLGGAHPDTQETLKVMQEVKQDADRAVIVSLTPSSDHLAPAEDTKESSPTLNPFTELQAGQTQAQMALKKGDITPLQQLLPQSLEVLDFTDIRTFVRSLGAYKRSLELTTQPSALTSEQLLDTFELALQLGDQALFNTLYEGTSSAETLLKALCDKYPTARTAITQRYHKMLEAAKKRKAT